MKEFITSATSLALSMGVFGLQVISDVMRNDEAPGRKTPAVRALDAVSDSAVDQFGPSLRATFRALDNIQRGITSMAFSTMSPLMSEMPGENPRPTFKTTV